MNRRDSLKIIAVAAGCVMLPAGSANAYGVESAIASPLSQDDRFETKRDGYNIKPAFTLLRMGDIKPTGWLKEQMVRDLRLGSAGNLDKLCVEASCDMFATGRNTPTSRHSIRGNTKIDWWNGETEGNWRAGYIMLAYLSEDAESMKHADEFVKHVLSFQDSDGYLGVYSSELKYGRDGDLWTQACLLRGLVAYAELTSSQSVLDAVIRCVNGILQAYAPGRVSFTWGQSHDLMIIDVLERLYDFTGDVRYRDFGQRYYEAWCAAAANIKRPGDDDVKLAPLLEEDHPYIGHGVHTVEHVRIPLWLTMATGSESYATASHHAIDRLGQYLLLSGTVVCNGSPAGMHTTEFIADKPPDPTLGESEYCAIKETENTFLSALQKTGSSIYGDRVERVFFNAAQGGRMQDGSALTYFSPDNRLQCIAKTQDGSGPEPRNKFSPTQADVAVCCNPMAANVAPLYVRSMWMRHTDGGLVALLYGPCSVSTHVNKVAVELSAKTSYPFESTVDIVVKPASATMFSLHFRIPEWSDSSSVICVGAEITREGDYWRVTKRWNAGDTVKLTFRPAIRSVVACNHEVALQYGALLFAHPIEASAQVIKKYPVSGFCDTYYAPAQAEGLQLAFRPEAGTKGFGFRPVPKKTTESMLRPFDSPTIMLRGTMTDLATGQPTSVDLIPFGNAPTLRRLTFPVAERADHAGKAS